MQTFEDKPTAPAQWIIGKFRKYFLQFRLYKVPCACVCFCSSKFQRKRTDTQTSHYARRRTRSRSNKHQTLLLGKFTQFAEGRAICFAVHLKHTALRLLKTCVSIWRAPGKRHQKSHEAQRSVPRTAKERTNGRHKINSCSSVLVLLRSLSLPLAAGSSM